MMQFKLFFLCVSFISLALADCSANSSCSFCVYIQQQEKCLLCKSQYSLQPTDSCLLNEKCSYPLVRNAMNDQCVTNCGQGEISLYNKSTEEYVCQSMKNCPYYIQLSPIQIIISVQNGIVFQNQIAIQVSIVQYSYEVLVYELQTNNLLITLRTAIDDTDSIKGISSKYSSTLSLVVIWSQSQTYTALITSSSSMKQITKKVNQGNDFEITAMNIQLDQNNSNLLGIQCIISSDSHIIISQFDYSTDSIVNTSFELSTQQLSSLSQTFFVSYDTIIGTAVYTPTAGNQQNMSFSLIVDYASQSFKYNQLCQIYTLNSQYLYVTQTSEILFYSSTKTEVSLSSFSSCISNSFSLGIFTPSLQLILDDINYYVFSIQSKQIQIIEYKQSIGLSSLSQAIDRYLDNSKLKLSRCKHSNGKIFCLDRTRLLLYQLSIDLIAHLVYTMNESITTNISIDTQTKLISFGNNKIVVSVDNEFMQNNNNINYCQYQLNDIPLLSYVNIISKSASLISNAFDNSFTALTLKLTNFTPATLQFISSLSSSNVDQLVIYSTSLIPFLIDTYLQSLSLQNLSLQNLISTFQSTHNVTLTKDNVLSSLEIDILNFSQDIQSVHLNFTGISSIIIKKMVFSSLKVEKSIILQVSDFSTVIIEELTVLKVTFVDDKSSVLQITGGEQVVINQLNISQCIFYQNPIITIQGVNELRINSGIIAANMYKGSVVQSDLSIHGYLVNILGCDLIFISNFNILQNLSTTAFNIKEYFINPNNEQFLNENTKVYLFSITIDSNKAVLNSQLIIQSYKLFASNLIVKNNQGLYSNGTIFIESQFSYIQTSTFLQNVAMSGGALFFNSNIKVQIFNSTFTQNLASTTGGAILLSNSIALLNSTVITNNQAIIGGGIRIELGRLNYVIWDNNCKITNNIGSLYGNNVVSRLVKREIYINGILTEELTDEEIVSWNKDIATYAKSYQFKKGIKISGIKSGDKVQFLVKLYDLDGKIFVYDPSLFSSFPPKIQYELIGMALGFIGIKVLAVGETVIGTFSKEKQGYFSQKIIIYGAPSKSLPLFIEENFIEFLASGNEQQRLLELQKPIFDVDIFQEYGIHSKYAYSQQNKTLVKQINGRRRVLQLKSLIVMLYSQYITSTGLIFTFKECNIGEIILNVNSYINITKCQKCPINSYTLQNNQNICMKCPDSAEVCQNSTIILKDGYWRSNFESDDIYECDSSKNSCQELTLYSSGKQCKQGTMGSLCEGCDLKGEVWGIKYSQSSFNKECTQCQSSKTLITLIILIFIFTLAFNLISIQMIIKNNYQDSIIYYLRAMSIANFQQISNRNISSSLIKILTHYLQIIAILCSMSIQLPQFMDFIPQFSGNSNYSLILLSECLYEQMNISNPLVARAIQSLIQPLLFAFFIIFFIWMMNSFQNKKKFYLVVVIYLIFFFQPEVVLYLFSFAMCRKLGQKYYLLIDSNYECYSQKQDFTLVIAFAIPYLLIWLFCPFVISLTLRKNKNKLHFQKFKNAYGFLYSEYKNQWYYFEFIKMGLKIVIGIVFTLLSYTSSLKFDCVALIIVVFIIILNKSNPFQNSIVFKIDVFTHLILLIAVFLQILLYHTQEETYKKSLQLLMHALNVSYISFMILIILISTLKSKIFFVSKLKQIKLIFSICLPFLKNTQIISPDLHFKIIKRWNFIRIHLKRIVNHTGAERREEELPKSFIIENETPQKEGEEEDKVNHNSESQDKQSLFGESIIPSEQMIFTQGNSITKQHKDFLKFGIMSEKLLFSEMKKQEN